MENLEANQSVSSDWVDQSALYEIKNYVEFSILVDVPGTFIIQETDDPTKEPINVYELSIKPKMITVTQSVMLSKRYYRYQYVNGPRAQQSLIIKENNRVDPIMQPTYQSCRIRQGISTSSEIDIRDKKSISIDIPTNLLGSKIVFLGYSELSNSYKKVVNDLNEEVHIMITPDTLVSLHYVMKSLSPLSKIKLSIINDDGTPAIQAEDITLALIAKK